MPRSSLIRLALLSALTTGCQRGCLSTWLQEHGALGKPSPSSPAFVPMYGVDCPDGLARCVDGVVEVSRVSHYPSPCSGPPEQCSCPWDSLGPCPRGCAADGVQILASPEHAVAQLCAPDPANPAMRPIAASAAPPGACEAEGGYRCVASVVVACSADDAGAPPHARGVASCLRGCFHDGDTVDDDALDDETAARILCAR